jgi:hypothetical protein
LAGVPCHIVHSGIDSPEEEKRQNKKQIINKYKEKEGEGASCMYICMYIILDNFLAVWQRV